MRLKVNGKLYEVSSHPDTPLLWVIREELRLTGTKFGCLKALCGSCTVLVDGEAVRSCSLPVKYSQGKDIITVEGIPEEHPVKRAWKEVGVPQCGYCQSGQIVSAYALLLRNSSPTKKEIINAMRGNLCRCGTYPRILKAIKLASEWLR